jgi:hypothetical protein
MRKNGPFPEPPPWSGDGSDEPYTEPADPWGDHPTDVAPGSAWGGHPPAETPWVGHSRSGMDAGPTFEAPQSFGVSALNAAPPGWGQPPPPRKRRSAPIVAIVAVLGLLICGGLGTTAWLLNQRGNGALGRTPTTAPSSLPATDAAVAPGPQTSADARFVAKGQCVRNEGTADRPEMEITACVSGTFEVLKRVDGRTTGEADAESKCNKVPRYTKWFFYDSELDSLDFVLCLRER